MSLLVAVLVVLGICCSVWLINALGLGAATNRALSIAVVVILVIVLVCILLGAFPVRFLR